MLRAGRSIGGTVRRWRMSGPRTLEPLRRRMGTIVDIGSTEDFPSRAYDIVYTLVIFLNLG